MLQLKFLKIATKWANDQEILLSQGYVFDQFQCLAKGIRSKTGAAHPIQIFFPLMMSQYFHRRCYEISGIFIELLKFSFKEFYEKCPLYNAGHLVIHNLLGIFWQVRLAARNNEVGVAPLSTHCDLMTHYGDINLRSGSTLAQVMACCWRASSHSLNQCWLIISKILVTFIWWQFHKRYISHQWLKLTQKLLI